MAIPTMPGVKRRKNIGNEIAEMMKGFAQGYKAFGGGDDRQSRADARNPYSDQNLAKYDSRINSTPLGRMFRGEEDVTGIDRGALRLQAKIRAAEEQGDVASLKKAQEDLRELYRMQEKGEILGKDRITVGSEKRAEGVPTDVPMPVARPQEFAGAAVDDGMDDDSSNAGSQVAMADPLYNDDGYYQPDYQIFAARGGPVEMPNRLIGIPMSGIDDNRVLTRPVEESDDDYSIDEPTDNDGPPDSAGLPTDPEELAPYAAEAVDAGYRKLSKDLTPASALSEEDPDYQARVAEYAAKTQRMTDDEVAELDRMVDPEGTMPQANRGVARMAAAYKFFKDRGEEDRADDVAARLIEYNEFAGNTRSMLGMQAIQQGNIKEGVKLLTDAYEQNIPDGKSVDTTINPDGSVSFAVGYKRAGPDGKISLSPIEERTIPLKDLPQFAFAITKEGQQELMRSGVSAAARRAAATGGSGRAAVGGGGGNDVQSALAKVRAAGEEARAAQASGDEERIAKAQAAVTSAVSAAHQLPIPRTRTGNQDTGIETRRRNIASALGQVSTGAGAGRASGGGSSIEERAEARAEAEKAKLIEQDKRIKAAGQVVGEEIKQTRRAIDDEAFPGKGQGQDQVDAQARRLSSATDADRVVKSADVKKDMSRIAMAVKNAPASLSLRERKELTTDMVSIAEAQLGKNFNLPNAETKDPKKATLTQDQYDVMVDSAMDIASRAKNDLSPDQAMRASMALLRGSLRPNEDGLLTAGRFPVALRPNLVAAIAEMRSKLEPELRRAAESQKPTASSSTAGRLAAGAARNVAGAIEAIPSVGAPTGPYVSPELANQQSAAEPVMRIFPASTPAERAQQPVVALQSELRFLQNKVARRSASEQELRAAQERIKQIRRAIDDEAFPGR